MALDTYANLKASIADFLNRDDLTTVIADFITLAEADFGPKIKHWRMEKRSNATTSAQFMDVPDDFLEPIRFGMDTKNEHRVEFASTAEMAQMRENTEDETGTPKFWTFTDGKIELFPTPDGTYTTELVYIASITALSDSNTTNWLLTYHPNVYLYGALVQSAPYLRDDERTGVWAAMYQTALDGVAESDRRARGGGSGLKLRARGVR